MQDADVISHVKTGEMNADVPIADVIKEFHLKKKINLLYLFILYGDLQIQILHSVTIIPQIPCIIANIKNSVMPKIFLRKQHFRILLR